MSQNLRTITTMRLGRLLPGTPGRPAHRPALPRGLEPLFSP
jgi:hypothetical protein